MQLRFAFIVTLPSAQSASPVQPEKTDPIIGTADNVTDVLLAYDSEQSTPQLIPGRLEVTAPVPDPALVTVSVYIAALIKPLTKAGVELLAVVPFPNSPESLAPQHLTPSAVVSAQVWDPSNPPPAVIALTPLVKPLTSTGVERLRVGPFPPDCPEELFPQHFTPPTVVRAQLWFPPAVIALTPLVKPVTSTGVELFKNVPFPNCPEVLYPQHWTPPAVVRAQVWDPPALIAVTPLVKPLTETGVSLWVVVPSPNCLEELFPQHWTLPTVVRAQVWKSPVAIALTPLKPLTFTGVERLEVELSPNCPEELFPQHWTPPPVVRAQVWFPPAAMALTPLVKPLTETGVSLWVVELSPNCPATLYPQHLIPLAVVRAQVCLSPAAITLTAWMKVAVTNLAAFIVTAQEVFVPVQSPDQPEKVVPVAVDVAVNITDVLLAYDEEQVAPQLIPGRLEVTAPVPAPALVTVSVNIWVVAVTNTVSELVACPSFTTRVAV